MASPYPQVVLFGDSLFQASCVMQDGFSFQAALQSRVIRRLDVVNRGMSGYNTSQCLRQIDDIILPPGPNVAKMEYLVILLGANDAVIPMNTTDQSVAVESYRENLRAIITHKTVQAHKPEKILLVTPPPLDEIKVTRLDLECGHNAATRKSKRSASYSQVAREVAAELSGSCSGATASKSPVVLIDLWKGIMDRAIDLCPEWKKGGFSAPPYLGDPECGLQGGLDVLLPDGLHMNGEAYRILADLVFPHIKPEYETAELDDRSEYVFPDWKVAPWLGKDRTSM